MTEKVLEYDADELMPLVKDLMMSSSEEEHMSTITKFQERFPALFESHILKAGKGKILMEDGNEKVVNELHEDMQAPGHRFPGKEGKEGDGVKGILIDYKTGKDGKAAPQNDPKDFSVKGDNTPYIKKAAMLSDVFFGTGLVKGFKTKKNPKTGETRHYAKPMNAGKLQQINRFKSIVGLAKLNAIVEAVEKGPVGPHIPKPAPPQIQEERLCPRCGGAPCSCPGDKGKSQKSMTQVAKVFGNLGPISDLSKSQDNILLKAPTDPYSTDVEKSEEAKGPTAVTMDAKDVVEKPSEKRPIKP